MMAVETARVESKVERIEREKPAPVTFNRGDEGEKKGLEETFKIIREKVCYKDISVTI